ncbi:unnamed protein product [Sphagnum jensenii]|uniref:Uncharacterized protein n=1 Tax=Sphagnum jensenii TaxID=128206 RepID=A0ABP0VNV3_9BRYO
MCALHAPVPFMSHMQLQCGALHTSPNNTNNNNNGRLMISPQQQQQQRSGSKTRVFIFAILSSKVEWRSSTEEEA